MTPPQKRRLSFWAFKKGVSLQLPVYHPWLSALKLSSDPIDPVDYDSTKCTWMLMSQSAEAKNQWPRVLAGDYPVIPEVGSYPPVITNLAHRWRYLTKLYLKNATVINYLKYEDFAANKEQAIFDLLTKLDIKPKTSIKSEMDKSFHCSDGIKITSADFWVKSLLMILPVYVPLA